MGAIIKALTLSTTLSTADGRANFDAHSTPPSHPFSCFDSCGSPCVDRDLAQAPPAGPRPPAPRSGRILLREPEVDSDIRDWKIAGGLARGGISEIRRGDGLPVRTRSRPSGVRRALSAKLGRRDGWVGFRAALF